MFKLQTQLHSCMHANHNCNINQACASTDMGTSGVCSHRIVAHDKMDKCACVYVSVYSVDIYCLLHTNEILYRSNIMYNNTKVYPSIHPCRYVHPSMLRCMHA